jgi:hypothetical protein
MEMRSRLSKQVGAIIAVLIIVAVSFGAAALGQQSTETDTKAPRPLTDIFDRSKPLMVEGAGEETSLAAAAEKAGYPIVRPAAAGDPSEVWIGDIGEGRFEVGLRYGEDLVVLLTPWPKGANPAAAFEDKVDAYRAGYTATISGHPAWVRPYDSTKDPFPVDALHVAARGVEVTLYGRTGIDDLIAYAEDLRA